jgi:hypothetical protein
MPEVQVEPGLQATQVTPLLPQAAVVEGVTQLVPWQHPLQLAGPQVTEETQRLLKQV